MHQAHARTARIPPSSIHLLRFDELATRDRARTFDALMAFLGWEDIVPVREFFETQLTAENAHGGRWKRQIAPEIVDRFDAEYHDVLGRLTKRGVPAP